VPGLGRKPRARVLGVDAALDRVPCRPQLRLRQPHGPALRHGDLLGDQVEPEDRLGHGVLDLDARVHLQEVEGVALALDQELHRAEPAVGEVPAERQRRLLHPLAQALVQAGRRRLLDQLLVAPLDRAVTVAEVDHGLPVPEQLHLHVPARRHEPLQVHARVAEGGGRLGGRPPDRLGEPAWFLDHPQPPAAAPAHRLDHHRPADLPRQAQGGLGPVGLSARQHRQAGGDRVRARPQLVADGVELRRRRADEHHPRGNARLGEPRVLGEEPVPRVQRVGAGRDRGADHGADVEVAGRRRGRADAHRPVGQPRGHRVEVRLGGRQHRLDTQAPAGAQHPHGDLAPVGDQHAAQDHGPSGSMRSSTVSFSANCAFPRQISATVPRTPASTEFISFMVSTMPTMLSAST
jgi:hypothetical protein